MHNHFLPDLTTIILVPPPPYYDCVILEYSLCINMAVCDHTCLLAATKKHENHLRNLLIGMLLQVCISTNLPRSINEYVFFFRYHNKEMTTI